MRTETRQRLKRIAPPPLWRFLRARREDLLFGLRGSFERRGLNVARAGDYYSPLPLQSELRRTRGRWTRPSALPGITWDLRAQEQTLGHLLRTYEQELADHPDAAQVKRRGFGPGFPALDAFALYAMLREHRPSRYLEVGSGVSTWFASLAARRNAEEGRPLRITCVEPRPYPRLKQLPDIELVVQQVQDVPLERFSELAEGDVLFIDSSHVLRLDGDVPFLFLEVLPRLVPGVLVHVHDIPFPFNCPHPAEHWVLDPSWPMFWNEAMVLQALLSHTDRYQIVLSTPLIRHYDEGFLRRNVRGYQGIEENPDTFSSLWLRVNR